MSIYLKNDMGIWLGGKMGLSKCAICKNEVECVLLDEPGARIIYKGWYEPTQEGEKHHRGQRLTFCPSCTTDLRLKVLELKREASTRPGRGGG